VRENWRQVDCIVAALGQRIAEHTLPGVVEPPMASQPRAAPCKMTRPALTMT
jgi:hypothetical protein